MSTQPQKNTEWYIRGWNDVASDGLTMMNDSITPEQRSDYHLGRHHAYSAKVDQGFVAHITDMPVHPAPARGKGVEERLAALESWRKLKDGEYVGPFSLAEQLKSERARLDAAEAAIRTLESHQGQAKVPTMDSTVANMQNAEIGRLVRLADHYRARLEESERLRLKQPSPAIESHPALSVPGVDVPAHSATEVDDADLQALHTTAIKCGMTNAYRGSLLQRIAKRMDDMHTEREPSSPQRTPAEVEGGESVGDRATRYKAERDEVAAENEKCHKIIDGWLGFPDDGTTSTETIDTRMESLNRPSEKARRLYYQNIVYNVCRRLDRINRAHGIMDEARKGKDGGSTIVCGTVERPSTEVQDLMMVVEKRMDALSTAPRGKVPSRDALIAACLEPIECNPNSTESFVATRCADAILALFTEGNVRG